VRIVDVRATPVYVPMIHPLRGSIGVETGMTRVIVELVTDEGLVGLGESPSTRWSSASVTGSAT
jgi:glucarate dehydratase